MRNIKMKCRVKDLAPEVLFDKEYEIFNVENKYYIIRENGVKLYIDKEYLSVFFEKIKNTDTIKQD